MDAVLWSLPWRLMIVWIALVPLTTTQPIVDLFIGTVHGDSTSFSYAQTYYTVNSFLGIPYAKAPVGELRLKRPVELQRPSDPYNASHPYNATYYRPFCMQATSDPKLDPGEDEDCLYLNVFVPAQEPDQPTGHAVMVWVYGGSFTSGYSNLYDSTVLAAAGNVIVVTLNYRLGVCGFFSTGSGDTGNYGLYDQIMAFQWVHDNIDSFGGDKNRVTIFGESAGAMSVDIQSFYPQNKGLFQRVISQSGVVATPYLDLTRDVTESFNIFVDAMNCSNEIADDADDVLECLRKYKWQEVKAVILKLEITHPYWLSTFCIPVADGDLVLSDYKHLDDGHPSLQFYRSLDYVIGQNKYDGAMSLMMLVPTGVNDFKPTREDLYLFMSVMNDLGVSDSVSTAIRKTIFHEYTNWVDANSFQIIRIQFVKALTDSCQIECTRC